MSTQPLATTSTTPASIKPVAPLDALKPLLNSNGELELSSLQIGERVQKFIEFRESCNFNLPLWDTAILSQFPIGTTLVPVPVVPGKQDAWRGADATKMKLKEGHVEPTADFILKLGNIAGVQLEKISEGINPETKLWSCRYNARIQLPNGEWLTIQDEGKDQEAFNNDGSPKAHVSEATRKKAKRNVVKNLLGIPTSMPESEFDRAWVILKPVFKAGQSTETDQIIAENKRMAEKAKSQLYGQTVDVQSEPVEQKGGLTVDAIKTMIRNAKSLEVLAGIEKDCESVPMTTTEKKTVFAILVAKRDELGEVKL